MSGYLYLIRNGDLYQIGRTINLERKIKNINPDEILKTVKLDNPKSFQVRLFRRYKSKRVPETEYFRLTKEEIADCILQMGSKRILPIRLEEEVKICFTGSIFLIFISFITLIYVGNGFLYGISISLFIGSVPMWLLFILGNFGGYDVKDLSLFSSWANRLKALFIAIPITALAYILLRVSI